MSPADLRNVVEELHVHRIETPIGELVIVADGRGRLCASEWSDQEANLHRTLRQHYAASGYSVAAAPSPGRLDTAIQSYFGGGFGVIARLPVATGGTEFQRQVWQTLRQIPCGETISYAELARRMDRISAVRAVGRASGANPVILVVPCHRVVGANGALTGYRGGIERQRWLLAHERRARAKPD